MPLVNGLTTGGVQDKEEWVRIINGPRTHLNPKEFDRVGPRSYELGVKRLFVGTGMIMPHAL